MSIRLNLPYPVSANRYWRSYVPKGWTRAVVALSPEAKDYKRVVGLMAREQGCHQPTGKPLEMRLTLIPKNGIVMDLGNCEKVLGDALQGIAYVNDKQIRRMVKEYGEADGKGGVIVEILEYEPKALPLFESSSLKKVSHETIDA